MGLNETFILHAAILSIYSHEGQRTPIMVPCGATITTTDGPLDGLRMIDVTWEDKTVMMFTIDVEQRATLVRTPTRQQVGKVRDRPNQQI
jgi:hypothetical protein